MSLYRCAVCGSSNVVPETKQEGYNKKKGIMGMAMFGLGGAVAGTSGNVVVYYHCAACGHTLNRCMSEMDKKFLEQYLLEPTKAANVNMLRNYKKQYPNIEWEEPAISEKNNMSCDSEKFDKQIEDTKVLPREISQQEIEVFQQKGALLKSIDNYAVATSILNALFMAQKPCTISEIMNIDESCRIYPIEKISGVMMKLVKKEILVKEIANYKAYFRTVPDTKEEALKLVPKDL